MAKGGGKLVNLGTAYGVGSKGQGGKNGTQKGSMNSPRPPVRSPVNNNLSKKGGGRGK